MVVFLWPSRDQFYPGGGFKGFTLFFPIFLPLFGEDAPIPRIYCISSNGSYKKDTQLVLVETQLQLRFKLAVCFLVEALSKLAEVVVYLILQVPVLCEKITGQTWLGLKLFFCRGVDTLPLLLGSMKSHMNWKSSFFVDKDFME